MSTGVVGLGYWGPNLLRVLQTAPDTGVRWICELVPERLDAFARQYPEARPTGSYQQLLDDDETDAVLIATPIQTHAEMVRRALEAGKHCLVEKPLALSSREAGELRALAVCRGLVLMCDFTFLYSPAVLAVREQIHSGELGDVLFISTSRAKGMHQRDVSVIWDLAPHDFSILLHWVGELPHSLIATGRDSMVRGVPDVAFITLEFPSGIVANVEVSWLAGTKVRRTVVAGSRKLVVYDDCVAEPVKVYEHGVIYQDQVRGRYDLFCGSGDVATVPLSDAEPLAAGVAAFVAAIRGESGSTEALAGMAHDVVRLAEAAQRSWAQHGRRIRPAVD